MPDNAEGRCLRRELPAQILLNTKASNRKPPRSNPRCFFRIAALGSPAGVCKMRNGSQRRIREPCKSGRLRVSRRNGRTDGKHAEPAGCHASESGPCHQHDDAHRIFCGQRPLHPTRGFRDKKYRLWKKATTATARRRCSKRFPRPERREPANQSVLCRSSRRSIVGHFAAGKRACGCSNELRTKQNRAMANPSRGKSMASRR